MERKHNPTLTSRAKELRKAMTEQERKLWNLFLKNYPVRFLRQKVIDLFIVDFYCASAKLAIELDGSQHFEEKAAAYDNQRTAGLWGKGIDVIRFTNRDFGAVCERIDDEVRRRMNS
jgi:very-short-patch-repair endonuclease